jgi:hypothetical protein
MPERRCWKNCGKIRFQSLSSLSSGWPERLVLVRACTGNRAGQSRRKTMFRKGLLAIAASLMTVAAFGSTLAVMGVGNQPAGQLA